MDKSNSKIYIDKFKNKIYKNSKGLYHRLDGPAIECRNGSKEWYKEGLYHRTDCPAIEYTNGDKYWWVLNQYLEGKEFNSWTLRIQRCI